MTVLEYLNTLLRPSFQKRETVIDKSPSSYDYYVMSYYKEIVVLI